MDYIKELADAQRKLFDLERQKGAIEQQIHGWAQIIEGLQVLAAEAQPDNIPDLPPDLEPVGMTDAIRKAFQMYRVPLSPTDVRDALVGMGFTGSSPKNLLINVHTILRRLKEANPPELEEVKRGDGEKAYRWVSQLERLIPPPPVMMPPPPPPGQDLFLPSSRRRRHLRKRRLSLEEARAVVAKLEPPPTEPIVKPEGTEKK